MKDVWRRTIRHVIGVLAVSAWTAIRPLFAENASSCPSVGASLGAVVVDPTRSPYGRGTAAGLLGVFHDRADIPLLLDILEHRVANVPPPTPSSGDPIRGGAVSGLALLGGRDVAAALARALADERRSSSIATQIARAMYDIGGPDVVPPSSARFSSSNPNLVIQVVGWLRALKATTAVPKIVSLVRHPNPTIRSRRKAGRLLLREFTGRFYGGCVAAHRALNELTAQNRIADCRYPQARSKAAAEWTTLVAVP